MSNLKITEIFKTFSPEELKQFEKVVKSPYFNESKLIKEYFLTLKKYYPEFDSPKLTKEYFYKKIVAGEKYNDQVMRNLNSEMLKLLEEFLLMINISRNRNEIKIHVIDELQHRGLFGYSSKILNQFEKYIDGNENLYDRDYFYLKYHLYFLKHQQYLKSNRQEEFLEIESEGIYRIFHFLYSLTINVSDSYVGWYNQNINKKEEAVTLFAKCLTSGKDLNGFLDFVKNKTSINPFVAEVFFYFVNAINCEDGEKSYYKLKELVIKNLPYLSRKEKCRLFDFLKISGTKLCNLDKFLSRKELFEIDKLMIENDAYKNYSHYPFRIHSYRSILMTALSANELEWVEKFITDHIDELPAEHIENMRNFSLAHLYFAKNQFELSLQFLSKVIIIIFPFKSDIKYLQLLLYYELGYLEEAISMLDSFRHFLIKNKNINSERKLNPQKFIYFYNKLLKLKTASNNFSNNERIELELLKKELQVEVAIKFKDWLFEKFNELNKD